jgi:hypothetical protein
MEVDSEGVSSFDPVNTYDPERPTEDLDQTISENGGSPSHQVGVSISVFLHF